MSPQDRDRLDAISQALANLVRRQREMEERLGRVEHGLEAAGWLKQRVEATAWPSSGQVAPEPAAAAAGLEAAGAPGLPPLPAPDAVAAPVPAAAGPEAAGAPAPPPGHAPPEPAPAAAVGPEVAGAPAPPRPASARTAGPETERFPEPAPPPPGLEGVFGLTWISRIGALTLVIGAGFFFKYAFENRWITETGRVFLGIALAAAALATGERLWSKGQAAYAQALTAAGIAFLYLAFWAAFGLYHLLDRTPALALLTGVTAGAALLSLRYGAAAIAAIGLAGGFLTPLLLDTRRDPWFVLGYALLLAAGAFGLARRWPRLQILSALGTVMLYSSQWASPIPSGERFGFTLFTLAFYALFAAGPVAAVAFTAQLLTGLIAAGIWGRDPAWLIPVVVAGAAGLAVADRRGSSWHTAASFVGLWLAYASWNSPARGEHVIWARFSAASAGFLLFLAWPLFRSGVRNLALRAVDLVLIALNAAFYFAAGFALLEPRHHGWIGLFAVAIALVEMSAAALLWRRDRRGAMLSAGAAWVLLALAVPIQFSGYRVSMAWSLEAAALAWTGSRLGDRRVSFAALLVFGLAFIRLLAVDSWMFRTVEYTALFNARFLAFAVSAAALWAAATWSRRDRTAAVTAYLAGHFLLLWSLCLEVSGQAARSASTQNVANVQSIAISILIACYAVALVAAGVALRRRLDRVAGIALIGFVVLKLYLYDIWRLPLLYRMAAFGALGVLLLATSYLYSRFGARIGGWLRPEEPATSLPSNPEARP